ncbi:hypothetical protein TNCV_3798831 [Trichonephila clavipes]|nr:hypothetical protein TNCV_3798831 [Trichonephila clavipes]
MINGYGPVNTVVMTQLVIKWARNETHDYNNGSGILWPDYKLRATRGLLATDHVILNHGQVTWTTPELAPHSPNYHTTPTGGRFSSRQISCASLPYTAGL